MPSSKELKDEANDDDAVSVDDNTDESDEATSSGVKRRKRKLGSRKKSKSSQEPEQDSDKDESIKEPSKNIDDIWNAFKKDVESERVKKTAKVDPIDEKKDVEGSSGTAKTEQDKPKTKTVTELFEFAGEAVAVEKVVPIDAPEPTTPLPPKITPTTSGPGPRKVAGGGLSSILGQIGKKNKLSILEKSKLDWSSFKKQEGIEEQLQTHNKGKDGFLEKQDFLQRTDLRQFEIEKAMRSTSRRSK